MFNLADVLQHPIDSLHPGALAQQQLILDLHHPVLHAPLNPDDQLDPLRKEPLGEHLLLPLNEPAVGEHPWEVRTAAHAGPPEVEGLQDQAAEGVK